MNNVCLFCPFCGGRQMLIDFGADINSIYRSPGNVVQTPLDCAMSKGFRSTAKYLQLHGGLPANKLRLSGRKPNALNDQELVTPLSFGADITRRPTDPNELKKNRSVVLYVGRSDSETNDSGLCVRRVGGAERTANGISLHFSLCAGGRAA